MPVGAGVVLLGGGSLAFLTLSGRVLGPERFGALAIFWMALHTIGPGAFFPVEQEVARAVTARIEQGRGAGDVVRRAALVALVGVLVLCSLVLLGRGPLAAALFSGDTALVDALVAGSAVMAAAYWSRGVLAGTGAWHGYATQLGLDGVLRVLGVVLLAALGSTSATTYAVVLVAAMVVPVALTTRSGVRRAGPPESGGSEELQVALGWLVLASAGGMLLLNAAPLAVELLADAAETAAAGNFVAALVLARLPLFLFAAVTAALLPSLTRSATLRDRGGFTRTVRRLTGCILAPGLAGVLLCAVGGPTVLHRVYGPEFDGERVVLVLLALSTTGFMGVSTLGQALVALRAYRSAAAGPLLGVALFVVLAASLPGGVAPRVASALVLAVGASLLYSALRLRVHLAALGVAAP